MNGFRLQCHVGSDGNILNYTRRGSLHTRVVSQPILNSFLQMEPATGISVFDCEWVKPMNQIFLFDILMLEGELLNRKTYLERYELLEGIFKITPHMRLLPMIRTVKTCMAHMLSESKYVEGLVFKALNRPGWMDTSIVRCRKN